MARARNIKPSIMDNEQLAELDPMMRLLFIFLWMLADREGRLEDRPRRIAAQALPFDRGVDVEEMLSALHEKGFIQRYKAGEKACILVCNFKKHQKPHSTERDSILPATDGNLTVHERGKNGSITGQYKLVNSSLTVNKQNVNALIPDSGYLIPDSLIHAHQPQKLSTDLAAVAAPPSTVVNKKPKKTRMPHDFGISERVRKWAAGKGFGKLDEHLESFQSKVAANGYEKISWDDFFMEAIREDWAKLRGRAPNGVAPPPDILSRSGPDPALEKIKQDRLKAVPMPAHVKAQIDQLFQRSGR